MGCCKRVLLGALIYHGSIARGLTKPLIPQCLRVSVTILTRLGAWIVLNLCLSTVSWILSGKLLKW
jgi:hypothetical protein